MFAFTGFLLLFCFVYTEQVCKASMAGITAELCEDGRIAQKEKEAALAKSAQERNWLRRGAKSKAESWRPKQLHRLHAMRWLCALDHQFKLCTGRVGLKFFQKNDTDPLWSNWRTWPFAAPNFDLGSDGCSGYHGVVYMKDFKLNIGGMQDHSHGCQRSVYNSLHKCGLYGLILLSVVSFNLPFGPDCEDARHKQIQETMADRYRTCKAKDMVLFQHLLPRVIAGFRHLGHEFTSTGGQTLEDEVLQFMAERMVFLRQGSRCCMVRFGAVAAACRWHACCNVFKCCGECL